VGGHLEWVVVRALEGVWWRRISEWTDRCFAFVFLLVFFLFGLVIDADVSLAHLLVLIYSANILQHCIAG
jgi:hypothetical protein